MMDVLANNKMLGAELREMLLLRFEPVAIKLIDNACDIPEGAIYPKRDLGKHIALCQAFAMTRRDRKTVYMDRTSEWCWNPLVGFGFIECVEGSEAFDLICRYLGIADRDAAKEFFSAFPRLEVGKYIGIVTAPLGSCAFEPDIVLIYCNNAQLRSLLWAIKNLTGKVVSTQLDAIDSCVYACVPAMQSGEFKVTIPDIGEYERALSSEDEIILSVPGGRIEGLTRSLRSFSDRGMGYGQLSKNMQLEFPHPPFYNELFRMWGLDR